MKRHVSTKLPGTAGAFPWADGNIGSNGRSQNDLVLSYGQPYHIEGWTIDPEENGTRFTNEATGHGMLVSIDNVEHFCRSPASLPGRA